MLNGLVIKRGTEYCARKSTKVRMDPDGSCWSEDIQKARVFLNHDQACRTARRVGGTVRLMTNGKVEE